MQNFLQKHHNIKNNKAIVYKFKKILAFAICKCTVITKLCKFVLNGT